MERKYENHNRDEAKEEKRRGLTSTLAWGDLNRREIAERRKVLLRLMIKELWSIYLVMLYSYFKFFISILNTESISTRRLETGQCEWKKGK